MITNKEEIEKLYRLYEENIHRNITTPEVSKLVRQCIKETDELSKELSQEQAEKLEHLLESENERGAEESKEIFIYGFSLAIKLFVDGLINVNVIIKDN